MRDAIIGLLPMIDQALADCVGVVDEVSLEPVAHMRDRMLARVAYPDDVLLAALAGGTGSGKSSLFNAVAGEEAAPTGGVRPTTARPQALVPLSSVSTLAGYLDEIGVEDRVSHRGHEWLCLIDLPDTDSVEVDHRQRVDSLLPRLDCVVWVVDPEKYRDASLHHGYLAPMAPYQSQFVFVLNQIDRLRPDEVGRVKADLAAALVEDGIGDPVVLETAAQPAVGPALGIEDLLTRLRQMVGGSVYEKSLIDLRAGFLPLLEAVGGSPGVDFDTRWDQVVDEAVAQVDAGEFSAAGQKVAAFLEQLGDETGGGPGKTMSEMAHAAPAVVLGAVVAAAAQPGAGSPKRRRPSWWPGRRAKPPTVSEAPGSEGIRVTLETEFGDPVRGMMARRARAQASIAELTLALNDLSRRSG